MAATASAGLFNASGDDSTRRQESWLTQVPVLDNAFSSTGDNESGMGDMAAAARMAETLESCEEEDQRPEDNGFLIKHLLVTLLHLVAKPTKKDWPVNAPAPPEPPPVEEAPPQPREDADDASAEASVSGSEEEAKVAEVTRPPTPPPPPVTYPPATIALLRCLRRVLDTSGARQMQGGLQELVLTYPLKPTEKVQTERRKTKVEEKMEAKVIAHNQFWMSFRDKRMKKWEGEGSVPSDPVSPPPSPTGASIVRRPTERHSVHLVSAAATASSLFQKTRSAPQLQSVHQLQRPSTMSACSSDIAAGTAQAPMVPSAGTMSSSWGFSSSSQWKKASTSISEKGRNVLGGFSSNLLADSPDRSITTPSNEIPTPSTMLPSNQHQGTTLEAIVGPSTLLPRAATPPTPALPPWQDLQGKRRKDHRIRGTVHPDFRRCCPTCAQASCNCLQTVYATMKAGRPRRKPVQPKIHLRPLELEELAKRSTNMRMKQRLQCDFLPLPSKEPPTAPLAEEEEDLRARAKPRPVLYETNDTTSHVQTEQWSYFAECERISKVPQIPRFLLDADAKYRQASKDPDSSVSTNDRDKKRVLDINLHYTQLTDRDLITLIEPMRTVGGKPISLDISRNGFTDKAVAAFVNDIPCQDLRYLNISYCGAGGLAALAVGIRMESGWTRLQELSMAGCRLADSAWKPLCDCFREHNNLVTLDLSETGLGCMTEQPLEEVMKFITSVPYVQYLDLSGNYFSYVSFELLAVTLRKPEVQLKMLDVSHNAVMPQTLLRRWRAYDKATASLPCFTNPQGEPRPPEGFLVPGPDERIGVDLPNYNAIILLCEALCENKTLVELRMANSFVDFAADVALLNSLLANTTIKRLDLSHNPHGVNGLRAIFRMITSRKTPLDACKIDDFRGGETGPGDVKFDLGAPSGKFDLELSHGQHRTLVRWLLNVAARNGINPPEKAFENVKFKMPTPPHPPAFCWKSEGGWGVSNAGSAKFDFDIPLNLEKEKSGAQAVEKYIRCRRVPVTLKRFCKLLGMFNSIRNSENQVTFLKAMSDTLLLKTCHVTQLLKACPEIGDVTVRILFGYLLDKHPLLVFDVLGKYKESARWFRFDARAAYFFNSHNPTQRYRLDLSNAMEHSVAMRMQVITYFEAATTQLSKRPDISQQGDWEGVRNCMWDRNSEGQAEKVSCAFVQWSVPDHGILSFDYVSAAPCGLKRKAQASSDEFVSSITSALEQSRCSAEDKLMALRSISRHLVLTPMQVRSLCTIFPNPSVRSPPQLNQTLSQERKANRLETYRREAFGGGRNLTSAFQFRFAKCRVEAFVCLFNRCVDPPMLCNSECLMNTALFSPGCVYEMFERLGRIRTFDVLNCSSPMTADITPSTTSSGVARMARTLQLLKEAEKAEKHGEGPVAEVGRRYEMNLGVYEDWICVTFLLSLSKEEKGQIRGCYWSEQDPSLAEQGLDFIPPKGWFNKAPRYGEFQFTYVTEKPSDEDARRSLAVNLLSWEPL
jgi:hypothetical protein